ncbi:MAG: glycosyltransferase family 4 protein [Leptospirales bacterium]|nr:glycosyltransferase family 4 protein [Leptospirales bacterium]
MTSRSFTIAVDARPLAFPGNGNAVYLHRMLLALCELRPDYRWQLIAHRGLHALHADLFSRSNVELEIDQGLMTKSGPLWLQCRLPTLLQRSTADLYWGSLSLLPLLARRRITAPIVVNFHDLNAFRAPDTMVAWNRWQHRLLDGPSLRAADRVLCLSETTRQDIIHFFPRLDASKLSVVYPGCEPGLDIRPPLQLPRSLSSESFFLCVGTIEPRKNQSTILAAHRQLRAHGERTVPLLIVGRRGWGEHALQQQLESGALEKEDVFYLGNASDAELRWCYRHALALLQPSLHEGFGLPVIEALAQGCPALLSDIPIFREIAPTQSFAAATDPAQWAQKMIAILKESEGRGVRSAPIDLADWSWLQRAKTLATILDEELERATSP